MTSLPSANVHSAKCSFFFANSSNFAFKSATSLVTLNSQLVAEVSVLISLTPSIFAKSPRTEAAQPPHVMLGTESLTNTKLLGSAACPAVSELAATAGGVVGAVCEVFCSSFLGVAGAAPWSQPDSPIKPETSNPARIAFFFMGSYSSNVRKMGRPIHRPSRRQNRSR